MIRYSKSVVNGEIVACEKHISSTLLNDLKRVGTPEFPYVLKKKKLNDFYFG